jgi:hypothetical protein
MPTDAKPLVTPPKFNYNLTIKNTTAEKFSCFPTAEEERTDEFLKVSKNQDQTDTEETASENLQSICSITKTRTIPLQHGDLSFPTRKNLFTKALLLSLGGKSPLRHHF